MCYLYVPDSFQHWNYTWNASSEVLAIKKVYNYNYYTWSLPIAMNGRVELVLLRNSNTIRSFYLIIVTFRWFLLLHLV